MVYASLYTPITGGVNTILAWKRSLLSLLGFKIDADDPGGEGQRQVIFDIWICHAWVRNPAMQNTSI
jgi:chemotaxis receptor (MCP) glutamine deamidase CheD